MFFLFFLLFFLSLIAIIIGLFSPKVVIKWGKKEKRTRGKVFLYYGILTIISFILFVVLAPELTPDEEVAYAAEQKLKGEQKLEKEKSKLKAQIQKESEEKAEEEAKEKADEEAKAQKEAEVKAEKKAKIQKELEVKAEKEARAKKEAEEKAEKKAKAQKEAEEKVAKKAQAKKEAEEKAIKDREAFINSAEEISYNNLARNPDSYKGTKVSLMGKVSQNMEDGDDVTLLLSVTEDEYGNWDDTILVNFTMTKGQDRILENDIIFLWGTVKGLITYESIFGEQITVPEVNGAYIEIIGNES